MNDRKGFTLTELLVTIGVIVVLIAILVPIIAHTKTQADIISQRADFQALTTALEQYRQDFGDYPRNTMYSTWNYEISNLPSPYPPLKLEASPCFTLASALLGPGPGGTSLVGSPAVEEAGDGNTGPGFRTQAQLFTTTVGTGSNPGDASIQVSALPPSWSTTTNKNISAPDWQQILSLTTLDIDPGTPIEETVGLDSSNIQPSNSSAPATLVLPISTIGSVTTKIALRYAHQSSANVLIRTAQGKMWPNYLASDKFKVAYINVSQYNGVNTLVNAPSNGYQYIGQPVLLDRWGQIIEYFPRYGPNNNRVGSTSSYTLGTPAPSQPYIGPLLGYSTPLTVYQSADVTTILGAPNPYRYAFNSIWDTRDGITLIKNGNGSQTVSSWTPSPLAVGNYDPGPAFQWMLGDDDGDDLIDNGETLRYDGGFVLISAGPNLYRPEIGSFCNFLVGDGTAKQIDKSLKPGVFQQFGNIYNFER